MNRAPHSRLPVNADIRRDVVHKTLSNANVIQLPGDLPQKPVCALLHGLSITVALIVRLITQPIF
ncbi:MAG TPA: hypothetical protein VGM03_03915 [Phycisphaerae bacterium]